jgi:hypothetical protein
LTSSDIQRAIRAHTANHVHQLENVYVHAWEADFFTVTKTGYSYEFEIKVSRSDFLADFKKEKHAIFRAHKKGAVVLPRGSSYVVLSLAERKNHPELDALRIPYSNIKPVKIGYKTCPNRFYFACPTNMIDPKELPLYAGLIYITAKGEIIEVVKPPYLHKEGFKEEEMLFSKYYWMAKNAEKEIMYWKNRCEMQQEQIKNLQTP